MADRKAQQELYRRRREQRESEDAAAQSRRQKLTRVGLAAGLAAALVAVVAIAVSAGGAGESGSTEETAQGSTGDFPDGSAPPMRIGEIGAAIEASGCQAKSFRSEGREHVPGRVRYAANPPHSGDHAQVPAEDGAYTGSPPTEGLVHSLEHGRVVIWFRPNLPAPERGALKAIFDEDPYHVVLAPREQMPYAVAATGWTKRVGCERMRPATFDALRAFRNSYRDRGPEYVP
jgi:hypothetical protein